MKLISLIFSLGLMHSNTTLAANQCKLQALDGSEFGICSDDNFTQALWVGDTFRVNQMLDVNPNLLFSCNFSPSLVYHGSNYEIMNPLIFSVCHTSYKFMKDTVQAILSRDAGEVNCETPHLKITTKSCLNRIPEGNLRTEMEILLKRYGMD